MKIKVNKIRNVEKSVCFAEQKIAYNYAFMWRTALEKIRNSDVEPSATTDKYQQIINYVIEGIQEKGIDKKYNIDAIIHCFKNGIENYLNGYSVLSSYDEIGRAFPCTYEYI